MNNKIPSLETFWEGNRKIIDTLIPQISKTIYTALFLNKEDISCKKIGEVYETIFDELGLEDNKLYKNRRRLITHIVVELLENLQKHSTIDEKHPARFELREEINPKNYTGRFVFETENYAEQKDFLWLQNKIANISDNNIKETYDNQMEKREYSEKWGAGLWIFSIIHKTKKRHWEMDTKDILRVEGDGFQEDNTSVGKINTKVSIPNNNIS